MIFRLGFDWLLMLILKMAFAGQIRTDKSWTVNAKSDIGYLIEWTDHKSPKLLYQLLSKAYE
jgi:hypothetical protein